MIRWKDTSRQSQVESFRGWTLFVEKNPGTRPYHAYVFPDWQPDEVNIADDYIGAYDTLEEAKDKAEKWALRNRAPRQRYASLDNWVMLKDAGARIVRPEFRIIATYAEMNTTEDSYEQGEIGRGNTVWYERNLGTFENVQQVIKTVSRTIGGPDSLRQWGVWDDGRIGAAYMVDENNSEATDREIEAWKRGEQRLWSAEVTVQILFSRVWSPDEGQMAKTLKLQRL